jgi:hypothetical protein
MRISVLLSPPDFPFNVKIGRSYAFEQQVIEIFPHATIPQID